MLRLLIPGLVGLMFLAGCGAKTESESKSETDAPKAELGEVTTGDPGASMLDDLADDDQQQQNETTDPKPNQPAPESNKDDTPSDTDDNSTSKNDAEPFIEIDKEEEDE